MTTSSRACGVLGDPVAHSLSPVLHQAAYAELGLDWTYEAHRVQAGGLAEFVDGLDDTWRGLSVTMPLKREAYALAARRTPAAELTGAVNTLVLGEDVLGDNTDLPGAMAAVRERTAADLRTAVVLGGGATATSVGLALVELGVRRVSVLVRAPGRAVDTARRIEAHPTAPSVTVEPLDAPDAWGRPVDIVVSTVPASAQGPQLVARLSATPCVFDVVYDPWPTPLAAAATGVVVSGLDLLVHQAALQLTLFTGLAAPLARMREAGEQALAGRARLPGGATP